MQEYDRSGLSYIGLTYRKFSGKRITIVFNDFLRQTKS